MALDDKLCLLSPKLWPWKVSKEWKVYTYVALVFTHWDDNYFCQHHGKASIVSITTIMILKVLEVIILW